MITPEQVCVAVRRTDGTRVAVAALLGVDGSQDGQLDELMRSMVVALMIKPGPFGRFAVVDGVLGRQEVLDRIEYSQGKAARLAAEEAAERAVVGAVPAVRPAARPAVPPADALRLGPVGVVRLG